MKVLFIGNSYTYYNEMPQLFEKLCRDNGKDVKVYSVTKGGRKLINYQDPEDPITQKIDQLLEGQRYDFCFIQEQSVLPAADPDLFFEGARFVVNKVKNHVSQFIMYATWGRKSGSETLAKHNWTTEEMNAQLLFSYRKVAESVGAKVSPVGSSFLKVTLSNPEINLHNPDFSHPSYHGSCLAALTHYYTLFEEFPCVTTSFDLSANEIFAFKNAVCAN